MPPGGIAACHQRFISPKLFPKSTDTFPKPMNGAWWRSAVNEHEQARTGGHSNKELCNGCDC